MRQLWHYLFSVFTYQSLHWNEKALLSKKNPKQQTNSQNKWYNSSVQVNKKEHHFSVPCKIVCLKHPFFSCLLKTWQSTWVFLRVLLLVWLYNHATSGWISHAKRNDNILESPEPALFRFLFLVCWWCHAKTKLTVLWLWGREGADRWIKCKIAAPFQNGWTLNTEVILNLINYYSVLLPLDQSI